LAENRFNWYYYLSKETENSVIDREFFNKNYPNVIYVLALCNLEDNIKAKNHGSPYRRGLDMAKVTPAFKYSIWLYIQMILIEQIIEDFPYRFFEAQSGTAIHVCNSS